jgi:hypothetical protein
VHIFENVAISPETSEAEKHQYNADPAIHDDADSDLDPTFRATKLVKLLNNSDTSVFLIPKNYNGTKENN